MDKEERLKKYEIFIEHIWQHSKDVMIAMNDKSFKAKSNKFDFINCKFCGKSMREITK